MKRPIYTFTGSAEANFLILKLIAMNSGGAFYNLKAPIDYHNIGSVSYKYLPIQDHAREVSEVYVKQNNLILDIHLCHLFWVMIDTLY